MAKPIKCFAEPPQAEPRDHRDFERFIQALDANHLPPCRPRGSNAAEAETH